jgi:uncharacterized protein YbbK (DUF523 family)/uncharacterized protein YbgA (DUF1722 family)
MDDTLRIGVSSCLLGEEVRWNGGHSRARYLTDVLGEFVEFVPVCPEVEVGMGVPRPTVRLVLRGEDVAMVDPASGTDWTAAMRRLSRRRVAELADEDLDGFILKSRSPTCGMERVKVYREDTSPLMSGRGLFADELMGRNPHLPVEEEGRLNDPVLRENFVERVFAFARLKALFVPRWGVGDVVAFHAREKLLLRAHDPSGSRDLGRFLAGAADLPRPAFAAEYQERFMVSMGKRTTVRKHVDVLQHSVGFLKKAGDELGRAEISEAIEDYRAGLVPLVVPVTILRHLARRHGQDYLLESSYLAPHPKELMLRNHV